METKDMRKLRFWAIADDTGAVSAAKNKKLLRAEMAVKGLDGFKGAKIRSFEICYTDHPDLAMKLIGATVDTLLASDYANVLSEYRA